MRLASILLWLLINPVLLAQAPYADLFPKPGTFAELPSEPEGMRLALQTCFTETSNGRLPSGYALIGFKSDNGKFKSRLESSAFKNVVLENCLVERSSMFRNSLPAERAWLYARVKSECKHKFKSEDFHADNVVCKLDVKLSSNKDRDVYDELVETHWQSRKIEGNKNYNTATSVLFELLRMKK